MNIDDLTMAEVKKLLVLFSDKNLEGGHPYKVGKNYLIRTVTMTQVGKLEYVGDKELVLSSASWIADTGRFYTALKTGELNEVEPFINDPIIGRGAIIDACIWDHDLPKEQK